VPKNRLIPVAALVFGVFSTGAAMADGLSGAYLAARQAVFYSDYRTAAQYFTRALARDTGNPLLLENTIQAFIGLGDVDRAVGIARKMQADGLESQIAQMVLFVDLVRKGDFDGVLTMQADGGSVGPLMDGLIQAWAELGAGNRDAALESFDRVAESQGTRAFGLYHKAVALAVLGDFEAAERIFSGEEHGPLRATRRGVIAQAQVLSQLGRQGDAVELLDKVFEGRTGPLITPLYEDLKAGKAVPVSLIKTPQEGMAEVFFTVAGALNGEASDAYTLIYTRMAEALFPGHVDAIMLSAELLENLERYELEIAAYAAVPVDHPSYYLAELGRADALRKSGKEDVAIEVLEQLSQTYPDLSPVHSKMGDSLRALKRYDEAVAAYSRAIDLSGEPGRGDWFLFYARGICNERIDRWDLAENDFRSALKLNPDQPQVLNYLGYSLVEKQVKLDEALELIEHAVRAAPNDGFITDSLGWALYRLRRFDEAAPIMERAAELIASDPVVSDHLGDALWAVGRHREARFQWRRALSFEPEEQDGERIRAKLDRGLDKVLEEEGAQPVLAASDDG
jgi:tetratricopeptide (TPR) repeat protein